MNHDNDNLRFGYQIRALAATVAVLALIGALMLTIKTNHPDLGQRNNCKSMFCDQEKDRTP